MIFSSGMKLFVAIAGTAFFTMGTTGTAHANTNGISPIRNSNSRVRAFSAPSEPLTPPTLNLGGAWYEFSFTEAGIPARGCAPTDSLGLGCAPSQAGNSVFVGAPAWEFIAPEAGAILTVTDAFRQGDIYDVFDFGNLIGSTSVVIPTDETCGDNPETCFANPASSKGVFNLASGLHSITITPSASPFGAGAAYFRIDEAPKSVPEPTTILGLLAVGAGVVMRRKAMV